MESNAIVALLLCKMAPVSSCESAFANPWGKVQRLLKALNRQRRCKDGCQHRKHGNGCPWHEPYIVNIGAIMAAAIRQATDQHHQGRHHG
jgi:hypothetical protein